ncbi:MAG TPA: ABC transporter permease [Trebonia sp.]|nr:ABC transporter permease [Trebonia sp.]
MSSSYLPRSRPGVSPGLTGIRLAGRAATRVWLFVVLFVVWWFWSAGSKSLYFPPLSQILKTVWDQWVTGPARAQLTTSLEHLVVGYAIAALVGIGVGALLYSLRYLRDATSPYLYFLYVLPAPVLVPAAMTLFGIGFTMKVVLIAFAAVWPTLLNTMDGMSGVDQVKLDTARVLGVSPAGRVFRVVLPAAAPQIVAGLRNSLQVAIILMVVSEWQASSDGIGFYISSAQQSFDYVGMWSSFIVLAIIGIVANLLFVVAENRALHWHYGARAVEGRNR